MSAAPPLPVERVAVPLGARGYEIVIGPGLLAEAGTLIAPFLRRPRAAIVTDAHLAAHHLPALQAALGRACIAAPALVLVPGEATKGWAGLERTVEWLIEAEVGRDDVVIALGGGVIGDLAGFAAAVLRRGVRFVQVPTSLLALVDSSVGGKTGINSARGKNLVGAFHQPSLVIADTGLLDTLPPRELRSGYGEVVKYGLLGDAAFFAWLEAEGPALLAGDAAARAHAVKHTCAMKAAIVGRDETEWGERALLNLGHTFGHALEAATGYSSRLLHGEAVAIGCMLALRLSQALGLCPREAPLRLAAHLRGVGLPRGLADIPGALPGADGLIALMAQDKKVRDGRIAFVLVREIGEAFLARDVDLAVVRAVLAETPAAAP
ncbi:3-dehydroquinate synthase [soil metagenome]